MVEGIKGVVDETLRVGVEVGDVGDGALGEGDEVGESFEEGVVEVVADEVGEDADPAFAAGARDMV